MNSIPFKFVLLTFAAAVFWTFGSEAQTIAEKKAGVSQPNQDMTPEMQKYLVEVNRELRTTQDELHLLYEHVYELYDLHATSDSYHNLLIQINLLRERISTLQNGWREMTLQSAHVEEYALWHQPETTLGQIVMDYGSQDYVYLLTPEIAAIRLNIDSNLLIPRASWEEMLDLILVQNGIGFKQLNPFLRELYFLKENKSGLKLITNKRRDLELFAPEARICFMLTPEPAEVRRTWIFLDKFVNPQSTVLQQIGRDIFIIGQVAEVKDLLKLYDFISTNKGDKEYKVIPVSRINAEEMAKILAAIFEHGGHGATPVDLGRKGPEPQERPARYKPSAPTSGNSQNLSEVNGSARRASSRPVCRSPSISYRLFCSGKRSQTSCYQ